MWEPNRWQDVTEAIGVLTEGFALDFKDARALGKSDEVAKDIAAMALYGGTLAYGIDETNEQASGITPVALSGQQNRVQQIADTAVSPRVDVDIRPIDDPSQAGRGVLIVVVPPSPAAPHMANDRYPARSGTTTRYLSEPEVAGLYGQRHAVEKGANDREPFSGFRWPQRLGDVPHQRRQSLGLLQLLIAPVSPQRHPHGARLAQPLQRAVIQASEVVGMYVTPRFTPTLLDDSQRWEPDGTLGWRTNPMITLPEDISSLRDLGVMTWASYTYPGSFSFVVMTVVDNETGGRSANEYVWTQETMAALAVAGSFYLDVVGVTFVHADLRLEGLYGARTAKLFQGRGAYVRNPLEVKDQAYSESGTYPVREIASDPRDACRGLLDRFFASFRGEDDVVTELAP
jgi:hypothetical protein